MQWLCKNVLGSKNAYMTLVIALIYEVVFQKQNFSIFFCRKRRCWKTLSNRMSFSEHIASLALDARKPCKRSALSVCQSLSLVCFEQHRRLQRVSYVMNTRVLCLIKQLLSPSLFQNNRGLLQSLSFCFIFCNDSSNQTKLCGENARFERP